jgi:hypothetical protein
MQSMRSLSPEEIQGRWLPNYLAVEAKLTLSSVTVPVPAVDVKQTTPSVYSGNERSPTTKSIQKGEHFYCALVEHL